MSLLDYDGLDYHTGKFKTWVKKLLEGKSNTGHKHTKSDITDFPNLGTASVKDVASTGNASTTQVVMGNDSRLSNARPASDVYAWAKASSKPSYSWDEITSKPSTFTPSDHTHSYLPLSGGTVEGDLEVKYNPGGSGGTLTAQNLRVKGDYTSGFSRNDMTSTTTLAINGNCYIYNSMGGHTSLKTDLVGSATNTVYLPSTDGTLTTSAGKSATYTSSLSSGSDTLFTQAGAYAMYSELNSNLDIVKTLLNDKFVWTNQKIVLKRDKTYLIIARPFSSIVDNCFIGIVLGGYDIMPIYKSSIITVTRNGNEYSFASTDVVADKISLLAIKIDYQ